MIYFVDCESMLCVKQTSTDILPVCQYIIKVIQGTIKEPVLVFIVCTTFIGNYILNTINHTIITQAITSNVQVSIIVFHDLFHCSLYSDIHSFKLV